MTFETEASRLSDHLQHDHSTDTKYHAVDFIETYTGRAVRPLHSHVEDISIIDIAHALSNQCRYAGHTEFFYSTAQHCCLLADYVAKDRKGTALDCLQILLHDSAEAYLVDIPRPVKQFMPEYRKWDRALTMCIREWAGLGRLPIPEWQDEVDSRIVSDEREQVHGDMSDNDWEHYALPLGVSITPWVPAIAEQQFLLRYATHSRAVFGSHQYLRSGWGISTNSNFVTAGSDIMQRGAISPQVITDLMEVDIRGGVGRVAVRSPNGMMMRDARAGKFPRPAWKFIHGKFEIISEEAGNALDQAH